MEVAFEILKYILPAAVVFVGIYFIMQSFFDTELKKFDRKFRADNSKLVTPTRMQAYERMILFLERISLNNLVMRVYCNNMSAKALQVELLKNIRTEFDHNISQQLYISTPTWKLIKSAREETIKVINSCSEQLNDNSTGLELSQFILELVGKIEATPTEVAIEALKRDLNRIF